VRRRYGVVIRMDKGGSGLSDDLIADLLSALRGG